MTYIDSLSPIDQDRYRLEQYERQHVDDESYARRMERKERQARQMHKEVQRDQ